MQETPIASNKTKVVQSFIRVEINIFLVDILIGVKELIGLALKI
jgi:hypothetical protein